MSTMCICITDIPFLSLVIRLGPTKRSILFGICFIIFLLQCIQLIVLFLSNVYIRNNRRLLDGTIFSNKCHSHVIRIRISSLSCLHIRFKIEFLSTDISRQSLRGKTLCAKRISYICKKSKSLDLSKWDICPAKSMNTIFMIDLIAVLCTHLHSCDSQSGRRKIKHTSIV